MIDGLKLTMTGAQLRAELERRIEWHERELQRLSKLSRTRPSFEEWPHPDEMLPVEVTRTRTRIDVLTFIRDYIVSDEVYSLGELDLRFADLLPDEDVWDYSRTSTEVTAWRSARQPPEPMSSAP